MRAIHSEQLLLKGCFNQTHMQRFFPAALAAYLNNAMPGKCSVRCLKRNLMLL